MFAGPTTARRRFSFLLLLGALALLPVLDDAAAQPGAGRAAGPPPGAGGAPGGGRFGGFGGGRGFGQAAAPAQDSAQVDLTGYWVALVTEDWLWRMITPPAGDATSVPLAFQAQRAAATWDPAQDAANGEACRAFGAAGLMRLPLRLHITWADPNTLQIETDAGEQTRLLRFGGAGASPAGAPAAGLPGNAGAAPTNAAAPAGSPPSERSWQGTTTAQWTIPAAGGFDLRAAISGRAAAAPTGPPQGALKAVTTNLRAGYLRKNGLPYSENAELTEYFTRVAAFGNDYLTVLSIVHDPANLSSDFVTSSHFKREPDDAGWNPTPCETAPPLAAGGQ